MRLTNLENRIFLAPDGAGGGDPTPVVPPAAPPVPPVVPPAVPPLITAEGAVEYKFAKVGEGDKATEVPEADVKAVTEFAKAHKLSVEQAQGFMTHHLSTKVAPVPETYTFAKVKNEKNEETDVSAEISGPIAEFAKTHKLPQDVAQALLDREIKLTGDAYSQMLEAENKTRTEWREHAKKDLVLSAGNFDENMGTARKALKLFFPEIDKTAGEHMFLDHPGILRGLLEIGKKISADGTLVVGSAAPSGDGGVSAMYPSMKK
jgi:hypothetical protein